MNERLQQLFHPWTSYLIVPLFALANAGIAIDGEFLAEGFVTDRARDPGRLRRRQARGHRRRHLARDSADPPSAATAGRLGGGRRRRHNRRGRLHGRLARRDPRVRGRQLEEAKLGILSAALGAALVTWLLFGPRRSCLGEPGSALCSAAEPLVDLYIDVDSERDHLRGPVDAPVTVVEYGDFECPYCGQGRTGRPRASARVRRRALRLAALAAERRPPTRSSRRKLPRPRPIRAPSGSCTTSCWHTRTLSIRTIWSPTPRSWGSTLSGSWTI